MTHYANNVDEFIDKNKTRYEIISSFQDQVNHITKDSFQSTVQFVKDNSEVFFKNKKSSLTFFYCLHHFSLYNYKQLELILDLALEFKTELQNSNLTDADMLDICCTFLNAVNYLFYINLISIETIIQQSNRNEILFINFYPEIEQYDPEYAQLRGKTLSKKINEIDELREFFEFVKSNPKQHIEYRNVNYHPSKLHKSIRDDDIETFQMLLSQNNYTVNHQIKHSYYERTSTCDKNVSLIQIAAVYGSVNIFKFLWMQNDIFLDDNLQFYSYSGRNFEIIHICEEKCPLANAVDFAISTHQNELVEYFLDNFEDEIEKDKMSLEKVEDDDNPYKKLSRSSIEVALRSLNYEIILPCLKRIVYIVNNIEKEEGSIPFMYVQSRTTMLQCAFFDLYLFEFIYNLNRESYCNIPLNLDKYSSAVFLGAYDAIKFMLNQVRKVDCYCYLSRFLKADPKVAGLILDIYEKDENDVVIKDFLSINFIDELFVKYNEKIVVRIIKLFHLFDDEQNQVNFEKISLEHLSSKMILSLCLKLSEFLTKDKLSNFVDFYIQNINNDEVKPDLVNIIKWHA